MTEKRHVLSKRHQEFFEDILCDDIQDIDTAIERHIDLVEHLAAWSSDLNKEVKRLRAENQILREKQNGIEARSH